MDDYLLSESDDLRLDELQRALDLYCVERGVSDDGERAYLATIAVAASESGLLASDAIVEELRRVAASRPYRPTKKRPGLREWYIRRLQELVGIPESAAVQLLDQLGLDWDALWREAKKLAKATDPARPVS